MISYSEYLNGIFPGIKIQKISIDAGFTCPNRDGRIGYGGCIYCRNDSFTPQYCSKDKGVKEQVKAGKDFFSRKYPDMKYLAYFQSYTNTYHNSIKYLEDIYREALECEDIVGLIIGTRPDTLDNEIFSLLSQINKEKPIFIEIGAESANDETLKLINRNHSWNDVVRAVSKAKENNLRCGLHLIAGLPGENKDRILETVKEAVKLPIETLKIHQLQILFGTPLFYLWERGEIEIHPFELEEYLDLCVEIIKIVPENIVIERFISQSPPEMVAAPKWNIKNYQFRHLLDKKIILSNLGK